MGNGDGRSPEGALDKALAVLGAFTPERGPIGVSDVARIAGVSKSTAFRILSTFVEWRYLEREGSAYAIGPRLSIQDSQRRDTRRDQLREIAMPVMQSLFEMTHETVHLAVLGDGVVEYLEKLFGPNAAKSPSRVGATLPANCSALGKAMLAFSDRPVQHQACTRLDRLTPYSITSPSVLCEQLQTIRSTHVAFDREESNLGLVCVAAPVFDPQHQVVAALSVSGAVHRYRPDRVAHSVRAAAERVSQALAHQTAA